MNEIKRKQLEVESWFKDNNKPFPATWSWESNEKGLFYIEPTTGKKRYGLIKSCKYCCRDFIGRLNWAHKAVVCSTFCKTETQKVEPIELSCSWCNNLIYKEKNKLNNSRSGLYFCNRKCKEEAQQIGGLEEIQPEHYKDGSASYSDRAFRYYGEKCCDCGLSFRPVLSVHHIDGDRKNGKIENLEVVCSLHHDLRHMYFNKKTNEWVISFKSLTPREKLDELRKLLVA
jgi:hypothetical protein